MKNDPLRSSFILAEPETSIVSDQLIDPAVFSDTDEHRPGRPPLTGPSTAERRDAVRRATVARATARAVTAYQRRYGDATFTAATLALAAADDPILFAALQEIAPDRFGIALSRNMLTRWLQALELVGDVRETDLRIERVDDGVWRFVPIAAA